MQKENELKSCYKKVCHPGRPLAGIFRRNNLNKEKTTLFNAIIGRCRNPAGRQTFRHDRLGFMGFTLIELLVVVLIIGILAAVALPQYQRVVEKSRAAQALTFLKSLAQAQETYYLANGQYATSFDELSVDIPWTGTTKWYTGNTTATDTRSNAEWSCQLVFSETSGTIMMGRLTGKYAGIGFAVVLSHDSMSGKEISCVERADSGIIYQGQAGSFCQKIMKGTLAYSATTRYYSLP